MDAIDEARWRAAWNLKVFGYINMTRAFLSLMAKRRRGVIINVIGLAGELPSYDYVCGSAGNAALMAFTRALAKSASADGIRVVGINPGAIATARQEMLARDRAQRQWGDPERWRENFAKLPFGRAGKPEEIGYAVAFLASPLSGYTSGTVISIDGGGT